MAAILVALKYPLSKAPALGCPRPGDGVQGRDRLGLIVGMVRQGAGHNQETLVFHGGLGIVMLSKPSLLLFFMMRDSGSVKLYWSLSRGPGVGGVGGRPRGLDPVWRDLASRSRTLAS